MILIKLKNDQEVWTENYTRETIDGITWLKFDTKAKSGKVAHRQIAFSQIAEIVDVGELEEKKVDTSDILEE